MESRIRDIVAHSKDHKTIISIVNLACEIAEKEKHTGEDKLKYAVDIFHIISDELHTQGKISDELFTQCEKLTSKDLEHYINEVVALWNKVVPLLKRLRKWLCKK